MGKLLRCKGFAAADWKWHIRKTYALRLAATSGRLRSSMNTVDRAVNRDVVPSQGTSSELRLSSQLNSLCATAG